jgi:hypothetical protein
MTDERERHPQPAPKGAPTAHSRGTPAREWTSDSAEEECATLEAACRDAQARGDATEVRRIEARLRLLRDDAR